MKVGRFLKDTFMEYNDNKWQDIIIDIIGFCLGLFLVHLLASCHKPEYIIKSDTLLVERTDTLVDYKERTVYVDRYEKSEKETLYVINDIGDTIKVKIREYVESKDVQIYKDSILSLQRALSALKSTKQSATYKKETPWYKGIDTFWAVLISMLAIISGVVIVRRYKRQKKC